MCESHLTASFGENEVVGIWQAADLFMATQVMCTFLKTKLTIRTNQAFTVPQRFMHVKGYSILVQIHLSFSNMANTKTIFIPAFVSSGKSHFVHAVVHAFAC